MLSRPVQGLMGAALSGSLVVAGWAAPSLAQAAGTAVTVTASPDPVAPGSTIDLVAAMPVSGAGVVSQEIVQQIDPAKVRITSLSDITYPVGWTLSFCSEANAADCANPPTNFSSTAPASAVAWAAVRAVRASGNIQSEGEEGGKQIATTTTAGTATPLTSSFSSVGATGGDGWDVFFDDVGHIFNIWHHNGRSGQTASTSTQRALDCHTRDGKQCDGLTSGSAWPFQMAPFATRNNSTGWVDVRNQRVWTASIAPGYKPGFVCIDVSDMTDPTYCDAKRGGRKFIEAGTSAAPSNSPYGRFDQFTVAGTKLYAIDVTDRVLMCVDTALNNGTGGLCPGQPYSLGDLGLTAWPVGTWSRLSDSGPTGYPLLNAYGTQLYGVTTDETLGATNKFFCWDSTTDAACTGWATPKDLAPSASNSNRPVPTRIYKQVDASGAIEGVCAVLMYDSTTAGPCYSPTGVSVTANTGLWTVARARATLGLGWAMMDASRTDHRDTRMIVSKGSCYDMALDAVCPGYRDPGSVYTVRFDPDMPDCMWSNQDVGGLIKSWTISTGAAGCVSPATTLVRFSGTTIVPRMACATTASGVRGWKAFQLITPSIGTGVGTLTVTNGGEEVPGWVNVAIPASGIVDLSALTAAESGQTPAFEVSFTAGTTVTSASAKVTAVGDAPELCIQPTAVPPCPTAYGPVDDSVLPGLVGTTTVTGSGSAQLSGGANTPYTPGSASFGITAPQASSCGSVLSGRVGIGATPGTGDGVAGIPVALLDSTGNPVTYPADWSDVSLRGQAVTAVTDADGGYSFGNVASGTYKVGFPSTATTQSVSAQTAAGATGSVTTLQNAVSGTSTSGAVVMELGTAGVVNGRYLVLAQGVADTSAGGQGLSQSVTPQANDIPTTGKAFSSNTVRLCSAAQTPNGCTATSVTVTDDSANAIGTYTVNTSTGVITFAPVASFTGVAPPVTYQVKDTNTTATYASSTYTPTVVPAGAVADDVSTGSWNVPQSASVLSNDAPGVLSGTPYPFDPASVRICSIATTNPASCTRSSLYVNQSQGTYSVNPATEEITFTPTSTFVGTALAIKYVVTDSLGRQLMATYTPTVIAPPSPTASNESKLVSPGSSVTFTTVTGAGGLGTSGGPALITTNTASGTGLCPVGKSLPGDVAFCTATSVTIAGEGTYTLNRSTGVVTYAALASASVGPKTPVEYVIRDSLTTGGRTNWAGGTLTPSIPGPPTVVDDTSSGAWDVPQVIDPLANDAPSLGLSLNRASVRLCDTATVNASCDDTTLVVAGEGTYTVDLTTGVVTFDPLPTFNGAATPIKYVVTQSDGLTDSGTITPSVAAPGVPAATDDTVLVVPGGVATFDPLMGAGGLSTSGGPALASVCLWVSGACDADGAVVVSGEGVWSLDPTTHVPTFTPCSAAGVPDASCTGPISGQPTPMDYRVTDDLGQTATGVLTARVPVPPTSLDDSSMAEAGAEQVITPLGNDTAGDAALDVTTLKLCGLSPAQTPPNCDQTSISTPAGTYVVSGGDVTFTPLDDTAGTDVPVAYQISDVYGQTSSAVIVVTELPKPAPRAAPDALSGPYGSTLTFSPLTNDSFGTVPADDSTSNVLTQVQNAGWQAGSLKLCGAGEAPASCTATSVTTADGTYVLSGNDVVFTGNASFTGVATQPVMYQVSNTYDVVVTDYNGSGTPVSTTNHQTGSSTLTPTITADPVAVVPDTATTPWNTPVTEDVLADDTSGAPIKHGQLKLCGPNDAGVCAQTSVSIAGQGTFEVVSGDVRFTPLPGFSGTATPITYRTTDDLGRPISSTFTPTVGAPNGPAAAPDAASVVRGQTVAFTTLASGGGLVTPGVNAAGTNAIVAGATCLLQPPTNTACVAGSTLVIAGEGTYELDALSGVVRFTADPNATPGPQTPVTYRVTDSLGLTATSTLTATVYAPPTAPTKTRTDVVNEDQVFNVLGTATHDATTSIAASSVRLCGADDTVPDCQQTSVILAGYGEFTVNPSTGAITFNPDDTYVGGVPTVIYSLDDTLGQHAYATITPTVVAMPTPAAVNDTGTAASGSPVVFQPWSNDDSVAGPLGASVTSAVLDPTSILLCGPGDVPLPAGAGCDDTTVTTIDGTYVVDLATGEVTFTGAPGFTGTATNPVTYQITTDYQINGGATQHGHATATLTPTITPPPPGGGGGGGGGTPPPGGGVPTPTPPTPVTQPDTGVGRPGEQVDVDPIDNDDAGTDQQFDQSSLRLCPAGTTPPDCADLVVQTPDGTWVVDPFTGTVVFTPGPVFAGLAEIPYILHTDGGDVVDSVISIWITDPPRAADDASSGLVDRPQTLDPWVNDEHDAAPWDRGSLALCGAGQSPPACDQVRVETPDGVYEIDGATGEVVFTPAPGFTGEATPVQYQVSDAAGQVVDAWLRPTVRSGDVPGVGTLVVVKKIVTGGKWRTGQVRLVTSCTDGVDTITRTHRLSTASKGNKWKVAVPAGMVCRVVERATGGPAVTPVKPTVDGVAWRGERAYRMSVGQSARVGTVVPIKRLDLSVRGGCQITADTVEAIEAGTCVIRWKARNALVRTTTTWAYQVKTARTVTERDSGQGRIADPVTIEANSTVKVTIGNAYAATDRVITRTVYVTDPCSPIGKSRPAGATLRGTGTCTTT